MLCVHPVRAFADNYIWVLENSDTRQAVVVDPGDPDPVRSFLSARGLSLAAVLATHHHPDHVGGIAALVTPGVPVFGPAREKIPGKTHDVADATRFTLPGAGCAVTTLEIPGHTLGHVAFYIAEIEALFCGDTLFGGGCGRLFEGTAEQMHQSLRRLAALPADTQVYCGHEYTIANLAFALAVEPDNGDVIGRRNADATKLSGGQPTLPSRIEIEKRTNPFLRTDVPSVRLAAERHAGRTLPDEVGVFAALRHWKDHFRA
jgi:hydroxyacylglutathione hydrolase